MHDQNLTTRFNWTDNDLFHFRNLNLRSRIEDNLASPEDDPISLFTLPGDICITTDLEVFDRNDPGAQFSSKRIAGCGLLEVVSDTVRSAIDMNQNAGQSINNAEAEFDAAVEHYNNGEWKLAYARFRKAYREAMDGFLGEVRDACSRRGIDHLLLLTDQDLGAALSHYLHARANAQHLRMSGRGHRGS